MQGEEGVSLSLVYKRRESHMSKQSRPNTALQRARIQCGLTQSRLAEEIGVSSKTVQRWECGSSSPRAYALHKLCTLFNKTPAELGFLDSSEEDKQDERTEWINETEDGVPRHCCPSTRLFLIIVGCTILGIVIVLISLRLS